MENYSDREKIIREENTSNAHKPLLSSLKTFESLLEDEWGQQSELSDLGMAFIVSEKESMEDISDKKVDVLSDLYNHAISPRAYQELTSGLLVSPIHPSKPLKPSKPTRDLHIASDELTYSPRALTSRYLSPRKPLTEQPRIAMHSPRIGRLVSPLNNNNNVIKRF